MIELDVNIELVFGVVVIVVICWIMLALDVVETLDFVVVVVVVEWSWIELMEVIAYKLDVKYQLIFFYFFNWQEFKKAFSKMMIDELISWVDLRSTDLSGQQTKITYRLHSQ